MFGKLLKYEFKSNGKVLFPAFALGISGALILHLFNWILQRALPPTIRDLPNGLFTAAVGVYAVCMGVFGLGYVVVRFFRTMVGNEAYLTLTLPVNNTLHIWAKLLSGFVYAVLGVITAILTIWAYKFEKISFPNFTNAEWSMIGLLIFIAVIFIIFLLMELYFSCAVGSQFKNKVVGSVVAYFVVNNAVGLLSIIIAVVSLRQMERTTPQWATDMVRFLETLEAAPALEVLKTFMGYMWSFALVATAYVAVIFAIQFIISRYLLTKKVNLE